MRTKLYLATCCCGMASLLMAQPTAKQAGKYAQTITAADLKKHLTIVAGAEMEGRETATPGEYKAAAYLIEQMKAIGLQPGNNGQWLQPYNVYRDSLTGATLEVNGRSYQLFKDFSATTANYNSQQAFGEVVYVNTSDSLWKNNKVDIAGKLVMIRVPGGGNNAGQPRAAAFGPANVMSQLMNKGAAAVLIAGDRVNTNTTDPVMGQMTVNKFPARQSPNSFSISDEVAASLLGADAEAEKTGKLLSKPIRAQVATSYQEKQLTLISNNILGILEGTDKKDEYLVITGHYDHIGRRGNIINYGADDDGSGTVSVLEMAEAFAKAKAEGKGPRRSILFMTVSGEEKGLWGSAYYAANPVYPLDKTTANLNIDMVGRTDTIYESKKDSALYVYVVGEDKLSSELPALSAAANKYTKLVLDQRYNDPNDRQRIYFRSDHYNFAKNGVPILFYFDGIHRDYHRPTDTVDKIEFDLMTRRVQLVFYTAWELANRQELLKRDKPLPASATTR
ncbi:MAG: M28 family peptidase [Chitinophagaceae bacterium]|nr:M28 family peptidase [Chitinophagaceae bacterium]